MSRLASIAVLFSALALSAAGQSLTCPGSPPAGCDRVHFHVRIWSPETKNVTEVTGINSFPSMQSCEEARRQQESANANALGFLATAAPRMKAQLNKYGPCHCDMTVEPSNPLFLDEAKRLSQRRQEQDTRNELLAELFDKGMASDSEIAMALTNAPSRLHPISLARNKPVPVESGSRLLGPVQLKDSSVSAVAKDGNWQSELKLMEVKIVRTAEGAPQETGGVQTNDFITSETGRIRELVLATAQSDSPNKGAILQASAERMQLLSKLGRLIEVAGPQSLLAKSAAAAAADAGSRRSFVAMLFGGAPADHWAPADPAAMSFPIPPEISSDPVAVLRDSSNRFSSEQRRLALYTFLLQNPLAESDEPWLSSIADTFLKEEP